ncbi:hypothetical protein NUH86_15960 [Sphingobium sp. JS3065]|uniref:hypothetical protein n=1 Tax=Sphingobium sp. JS3065 TaxID=2970925 RepID=UPI0022641153|nr:hypothetical protein [Sphingobium sp. JS3065]UZW54949.1 hypothetical protein NUH86_15960 [Sphingobium sp. JS3065]
MTDSEFVFDGGPKWRPERALDHADKLGVEGEITAALEALHRANSPAPSRWFGQRLPVLWTMFMAARSADPRALTIWMAETARLLADLPHDILAASLDEAIKHSCHGFLPSVGEIRSFAKPMLIERAKYIERLSAMKAALEDPAASAERETRRQEMAMRAAHSGDGGLA